MTRAGRIAVVTIGLISAGIILGALAGGSAFTIVGLLAGERMSTDAFGFGAIFGAPLGAVTAPLLSWLLLRRVPIGRMLLFCTIGTVIGGVIGWFATTAPENLLVNPIAGAFVGCTLAALVLSYRARGSTVADLR